MSRCFDSISRIYRDHIQPHVPDETLCLMFGGVLQSMHDANHKVNDAINKDPTVSGDVTDLEDYVKGAEEAGILKRAEAVKTAVMAQTMNGVRITDVVRGGAPCRGTPGAADQPCSSPVVHITIHDERTGKDLVFVRAEPQPMKVAE